MKKEQLHRLTRAAVVGALYAAVTLLTAPISFGTIQCRVSEALCLLPWLFPETGCGLFAGCLIANVIGNGSPLDIVFGSMATLLAALMTGHIRPKALAALPPVVVNGVMVGAALSYAAAPDAFWVSFPLIALEVAAGEAIAVYALGLPLLSLLGRIPMFREAQARKLR